MNRAEQTCHVVDNLRRIGVSEPQIATVLGVKPETLRWTLTRYRAEGAVLARPTRGTLDHVQGAIVALVLALSSGKLDRDAALLVITAHPSRLAMRDAAARLVSHGMVEVDDVSWLLRHLGGRAPRAPNKATKTTELAA
jgi:hypothetical protein